MGQPDGLYLTKESHDPRRGDKGCGAGKNNGSSLGEQTSGGHRPKGGTNGLGYGKKPPLAFRSLYEACEKCLGHGTHGQKVTASSISA